jgi:hypothetical protein
MTEPLIEDEYNMSEVLQNGKLCRYMNIKVLFVIPWRYLHSFNDLPSMTETKPDKTVVSWHNRGVLHRVGMGDDPAHVEIMNDIMVLHYVRGGQYYRPNDRPTVVIKKNDEITAEFYKVGTLKKSINYRPNMRPSSLIRGAANISWARYYHSGMIQTYHNSMMIARGNAGCVPQFSCSTVGSKKRLNILCRQHGNCTSVIHALYTEGEQISEYTDEHGAIHSNNDQPAIVYSSGTKIWAAHGIITRADDKPAAELIIGGRKITLWMVNGELFRSTDAPLIIDEVHNMVVYNHVEGFRFSACLLT